jgi:hypothetical protein
MQKVENSSPFIRLRRPPPRGAGRRLGTDKRDTAQHARKLIPLFVAEPGRPGAHSSSHEPRSLSRYVFRAAAWRRVAAERIHQAARPERSC